MADLDSANARTQEEHNAADAAIRLIIIDEDSGKIPFVGIEESLPAYVGNVHPDQKAIIGQET